MTFVIGILLLYKEIKIDKYRSREAEVDHQGVSG